MFSEILKIKPQLDSGDLRRMENTLNARFRRVAKRFGRGIVNVFKAGGGIGLVLGFINKFLNPLKETQEAIDRLLKSSDDIATNAKAFDTTTGKLYKLVKLAEASGLQQDNLFQMLSKYQTVVGRARRDPNDPLAPVVQQYTGDKDLVDSFFSFIQDIRKLDQKDQAVVKSTVFGEDMAIKLNDFMQQDFVKRLGETGLDKVAAEKFTKSIDKLASFSDLQDALKVRRESQDVLKKARIINEGMIREQDKTARIQLQKENQRIQSYKDLQAISQTTDRIMVLIESGIQKLGAFIGMITPKVNELVEMIRRISNSKLVKGVGSWFGGDD